MNVNVPSRCRAPLARFFAWFLLFSALAQPLCATAQSKNRAPGFESLAKGATIVIMPADIELFELSAGGVLEPKADWTEAASRHFRSAIEARRAQLDMKTVVLGEKDVDEIAEINSLHAAVSRAIALHHFGPGNMALPTKNGKLDWSMGESVQAIKRKTGADYVFFSWIRDSYTSSERAAAMILLALVGVGIGGGVQVGHASLVDLNTGQVLWFNRLARASGDLREAAKAAETLDALLENFPAAK
jgi:hypothetical protein